MNFYDELRQYDWTGIEREILRRTPADVERALGAGALTMDDFMSLVSPAAEPFVEEMARKAHRLTVRRFGRIIGMFAPLYVSNVCTNRCVYCGFNAGNSVERRTLSVEQAVHEGRAINALGFRHLLLVCGEAPRIVTMEYLTGITERLRSLFGSLAVEIFPLSTEEYERLIAAGVDGLTVFQETYNESVYKEVHPKGRKSDFGWRLETPTRGGWAGFRKIGLGALLGLTDWRTESFFLALHARWLMKNFWKSQVSFSFPRLRPAAGAFQPPCPVSDLNMVQMMTALRLLLPDAGLTLSTRESADLRDHLIPLGITSMSAGSHTEPGGYAERSEAEAQFKIADERSPAAVAAVIREKGYEPVWKDWDAAFLHRNAPAAVNTDCGERGRPCGSP
ncbi:MAG: 2-iminoacetate synthase ThiH [Desulfobacteraceae bacterium]|nr:2-iminoacetate synthase ThiH [Desulfobacteraceae bacterium]